MLNERAFTLFTALISFILIALTMLLISSMTATSTNTENIIASIEEQTKMQALADLARADAVQTFNYGVRRRFEEYFLGESRVTITRGQTWEDIKKEFARTFFASEPSTENPYGVRAFADNATAYIEDILSNSPAIPGFTVTLTKGATKELNDVLQKSVLKSLSDPSKKFFEVVECEGIISNCVIGTFFVNLDLSEVTDKEYEKLPQIRVENDSTGRVIKEPILPRTNYRIYFPIRIFKAIAIGRTISDPGTGLLSSGLKTQIESYGIGFCDPNQCSPRNEILPGKLSTKVGLCPGDSGASTLVNFANETIDPIPFTTGYHSSIKEYRATSLDSGQPVLRDKILEKICTHATTSIPSLSGHNVELIGTKCGGKIQDISLILEQQETVTVKGELEITAGAIPSFGGSSATPGTTTRGPYTLNCLKPSKMEITFLVREKDKKYMVNERNYSTNPLAGFKIEIQDKYTPSSTKWNCLSKCTKSDISPGCQVKTCTPI